MFVDILGLSWKINSKNLKSRYSVGLSQIIGKPMDALKDKNQFIIGAVVLVVLAGVIGFWLGWTAAQRSGGERRVGEGDGVDFSNVVLGGNSVLVNDQAAGKMVRVVTLNLAQDGWVAIHEDRDGKPANILGAQWFPAGQGQSGSVDLLRSSENGKVYYAMLHSDDGDRKFDHTKDLPLADPQGSPIMVRFLATTKAAE